MNNSLTESKKYKVLLFGMKVVGGISSLIIDYCDVTLCYFPGKGEFEKIERLSEYDVIVLDFTAFGESDKYQVQVFEKQLSQAVNSGKTVCFLH